MANLFFTFFGFDAIVKKRMGRIKIATIGNPGMHMPSLAGILPGFSAFATSMMMKTVDMFKPSSPEAGVVERYPVLLRRGSSISPGPPPGTRYFLRMQS
jgi:hypothetical protein